jgi:hypothetical protein
MEQGRTLNLRKQIGGGSERRTRLVLLLALAGMLLGAWFRFREIPEAYRALLIGAVVGGSYLFVVYRRKRRKAAALPTTKLEISEEAFSVLGPHSSRVAIPWSAFSECVESHDLFVLVDRPKSSFFVVPKRAFPSESWLTWFREQATSGPIQTRPSSSEPAALAPSTAAGRIRLSFRLGFRDYVDRTVASWLTRGICLVVAGALVGISLYAAAHPPPRAVNSNTKVFFMFVCPFYLVLVTMVVLMSSIRGWLAHRKYTGLQQVALSDVSVEFAGADGTGAVPWTSFKHYKETLWSFILWRGPIWMLLPKRAFASEDDLCRCRELLDRHLQRSGWFVG